MEGVDKVEDEYGHVYTIADFLAVLDECPIRFDNLVGRLFS